MIPATRLLLRKLGEPAAPRVFTTMSFYGFARGLDAEPVSERSFDRLIDSLSSAQILIKVRRGLFINALARPKVQLAEIAQFIRQGAVVDLATVLGDCGALNNVASEVTCIIPLSPNVSAPSVGVVDTEAGRFRFFGMTGAIFTAGEIDDREAATSYKRSTPEAALLHWIYLSNSGRSRLTQPPLDLDLTLLDKRRLSRLARAKGLLEQYLQWTRQVAEYRSSPDVEANTSGILGF